jgi:hypothetical protein
MVSFSEASAPGVSRDLVVERVAGRFEFVEGGVGVFFVLEVEVRLRDRYPITSE